MTLWPGIVLGTMLWVGGVRALKVHSFIHSFKTEDLKNM